MLEVVHHTFSDQNVGVAKYNADLTAEYYDFLNKISQNSQIIIAHRKLRFTN